jgi:hypothetical protein
VIAAGEANAFPFMPRIRQHCSVEMTLDKYVRSMWGC